MKQPNDRILQRTEWKTSKFPATGTNPDAGLSGASADSVQYDAQRNNHTVYQMKYVLHYFNRSLHCSIIVCSPRCHMKSEILKQRSLKFLKSELNPCPEKVADKKMSMPRIGSRPIIINNE